MEEAFVLPPLAKTVEFAYTLPCGAVVSKYILDSLDIFPCLSTALKVYNPSPAVLEIVEPFVYVVHVVLPGFLY